MIVSVHQGRDFGNENPSEGTPSELLAVEVRDDADRHLFWVFLQPTERGCGVQIDAGGIETELGTHLSDVSTTPNRILARVEHPDDEPPTAEVVQLGSLRVAGQCPGDEPDDAS